MDSAPCHAAHQDKGQHDVHGHGGGDVFPFGNAPFPQEVFRPVDGGDQQEKEKHVKQEKRGVGAVSRQQLRQHPGQGDDRHSGQGDAVGPAVESPRSDARPPSRHGPL